MRFAIQTVLVLLMSAFCAFAFAAGTETSSHADLTLPATLAAKPGQMVFVDFYSPFCGTCQAMEPYVESLKAESGNHIAFKRVDLAEEGNADIADRFGVNGTPAYFLFDANGKLVYSMEHIIIPKLLRPKVLGAAGILPTQKFPADLHVSPTDDNTVNYTVVTFDSKTCDSCDAMNKYLQAMAFTEDDHLKIVHLNADDKPVKKFMEDIKLPEGPAYILYDNEAHELVRLEGAIDPQDFWQYYTLFAHPETALLNEDNTTPTDADSLDDDEDDE